MRAPVQRRADDAADYRGAVADDNSDARTLLDGIRVGIPYLT
jgi:hypothetical protein